MKSSKSQAKEKIIKKEMSKTCGGKKAKDKSQAFSVTCAKLFALRTKTSVVLKSMNCWTNLTFYIFVYNTLNFVCMKVVHCSEELPSELLHQMLC